MKRNLLSFPGIPGLLAVACLLTGCPLDSDPCSDADKAGLLSLLGQLTGRLADLEDPPPAKEGTPPLPPVVPPSAKQKVIKATAGSDSGPIAQFKGFPNASTGKFISQVTVTYSKLTGLTDGESSGGLRFVQSEYQNGLGRNRYLAARLDGSINGLRVFMGDYDGTPFSALFPFPDTYMVDLQIEQMDDVLVYQARKTQDPPVPGGWTTIYVEVGPLDPAPFNLDIGMAKVKKGAAFSFFRFALEGNGIGGEAEGPIIARLKDSAEALRAAQTKINASSPDLPGALADLSTATSAHDEADEMIYTAMIDDMLQRPSSGVVARKSLKALPKELATARAAIETLDPKKAKGQLTRLKKAVQAQESAMMNMLGLKPPSFASIPETVFSLRVPQ